MPAAPDSERPVLAARPEGGATGTRRRTTTLVRRMLPPLVAAAILAGACTTGETGPEPQGEYLSQLRGVARDVNTAIDSVDTALEGAYAGTPEQLFLALADTRAANDVAIARDKAGRLEPGPGHTADHERFLTFLDFALGRVRDLDAAVAEGDAVGAAAISFELEVAAGLLFVGLTPEVCDVVTFNPRLCRRPVSEESFATTLHIHMLRLTAAYLPGIDDLPIALTPIAHNGYIAAVGPTMIEVLRSALAGVSDLAPPPEAAEDHQRLVTYLADAADAHERSLAAAEFGDTVSMQAAHRAAQRAFCTTGAALSREGRRYMAVFFLDELGICNP